jgi:hypothetical protein
MEAHREGWAKMPIAIAGAPLAWRVRGSASFGKIFETLRTLVLKLPGTRPSTPSSRRISQAPASGRFAVHGPITGRAPLTLCSASAPRLREAVTGITSFADRTKIAARIAEPSAARYRCAFKHG